MDAPLCSRPQENSHRRPEVLNQSLIRVNSGRHQWHYIWKTVQNASKEVPTQVAQAGNIWPLGRIVRGFSTQHILAKFIDKADMHMAAAARQALARLCHETRSDTMLRGNRLYHISLAERPLSELYRLKNVGLT